MTSSEQEFHDELTLVARALDGTGDGTGDRDSVALVELRRRDADGSIARRHRIGPILAAAQVAAGLEPAKRHEPWKRDRMMSAVTHERLTRDLEALGEYLSQHEVPWAPIKGMDLATRVYATPEERLTGDLDILVPEDLVDRALDAARAAGCTPLHEGPHYDRFLRDESYAWQGRTGTHNLVEIHYRLWAQVSPRMPGRLLASAEIEHGQRRRLDLAHAYLVAAVHAFTVDPPRGAGIWLDLPRIADHAAEAGDGADLDLAHHIVDEANLLDLQLPVALAAGLSAELWGRPVCRHVARSLEPHLRWSEARLRARHAHRVAALELRHLVLARHLARRDARQGLIHAAWRRLWPHPGVVERATEPGWWPRRRLSFQWQRSREWFRGGR